VSPKSCQIAIPISVIGN